MIRAMRVALTVVMAAGLLVPVPVAHAASSQETMLQDDPNVFTNPAATFQRLRLLGVDRVRVSVRWSWIAPNGLSRRRPSHFNATDPAAYPGINWVQLDKLVREAANQNVPLNLNVTGGAPIWATPPGAPNDGKVHADWQPSGREFGYFVTALATRYSGNYDPAKKRTSRGDPNDLPAVHFWSIWNEPDYGPSLAPQGVPGNFSVERSPWAYRSLVDSAWSALQRLGRGHDTFVFGELAPRGEARIGIFNGMKPLQFIRALYCVDSSYRPLRGSAATLRGCPATSSGSHAFPSQHPALFKANGFSDHPYSRWYQPNVEAQPDPEYTTLAEISNLERALDRAMRVYHSHTRFPIWNTEYGYLTSPPKRSPDPTNHVPYLNQTTAAYYDNWAEYISWRDPRLASFMQYLLSDPLPSIKDNDYGGFASGLLTFAQKEKPGYGAFRIPVYLPVTSSRRGSSLEVWGAARPAHWAMIDVPADPETVQIQFKPSSGGGSFTTVKTITLTDPHGYFDTHVSFPGSGTVRLSYTYPSDDPLLSPGDTVFSRNVSITLN
jgi:hypothetical protein